MLYLALLRGINVGGNNKVEMKKLKTTFEQVGMKKVKTYINTGNVIFSDDTHQKKDLINTLETAIEKTFGFHVKVLLRTFDEIKSVIDNLPQNWQNNSDMKCDVMFLWEEVDDPQILTQLDFDNKMEDIKYLPGTVLWRINRDKITKSGILKIIGTPLYKKMTIRNCNTVRKLYSLMQIN